MDTLTYILDKYHIKARQSPIEIPNTGRITLVALFAELGYKIGAEIGTAAGEYAEMLCQANPEATLFCVDPYQTYKEYRDYLNSEKLTELHLQAEQRLAPYKVSFVLKFSMEAVGYFADESLDFVYIDANHEWPYITQDIYHWSRKVRKGGIVSGHDYYRSARLDTKCHVIGTVNGYTAAFFIRPWFLLGTKAKTPGLIRDAARSWFWVKE